MAFLTIGVNGPFTGKVGNVVGSSWLRKSKIWKSQLSLAVIMVVLASIACKTNKQISRQQERSVRAVLSGSQSVETEKRQVLGTRMSRDSSEELYQITIFPVDTFQFSIGKGFSGRADKMEIKGYGRSFSIWGDSIVSNTERGIYTDNRSASVAKSEQQLDSRAVKKTGVDGVWWLGVGFLIGIGLLVGFRRWERKHF